MNPRQINQALDLKLESFLSGREQGPVADRLRRLKAKVKNAVRMNDHGATYAAVAKISKLMLELEDEEARK